MALISRKDSFLSLKPTFEGLAAPLCRSLRGKAGRPQVQKLWGTARSPREVGLALKPGRPGLPVSLFHGSCPTRTQPMCLAPTQAGDGRYSRRNLGSARSTRGDVDAPRTREGCPPGGASVSPSVKRGD